MPNPNPKKEYLVTQKPGWKHQPTKAIRVPEILSEEIERYARLLDDGSNPHNLEFILKLIDFLELEEMIRLDSEILALIAIKKEQQIDDCLEQAILYLSDKCDGAHAKDAKDGNGFNAIDAEFGHWLAKYIRQGQGQLNLNYAIAAHKMLQKYAKQLQQNGFDLPPWEAIAHQYPLSSQSVAEGERRIEIKDDRIAVYAPYDSSGKFQRDCKSIEGYKFEGSDKSWRFPLRKVEEVIEKLTTDASN